jgi:hypothetical protein
MTLPRPLVHLVLLAAIGLGMLAGTRLFGFFGG